MRSFVYTDAVVTEKFHATTSNPFDGTVIFQPLEDTYNRLQVTLTNSSGAVVQTKTYELPGSTDMIPNAAAYNPAVQMYVVTGFCTGLSTFTQGSSWYILLDQDLNLISAQLFSFKSSFPATTPPSNSFDQSTFVTDVCPVLYENGVDFAFTGVILNNSVDPDIGVANPSDRMLFIAKMKTSGPTIVDWREYDFNVSGATTYATYPSRITEIGNVSNSYPGYLVGGTTKANHPAVAFYMRTDNALTTVDAKYIEDVNANPDYGTFAIGDIYYDNGTQEAYIAGTISFDNNNGNGLYFFDKLDNITASINVGSFISTWSGAVGAYELPLQDLNGWPKVGRIAPGNAAPWVITGVLYENSPGPWAITLKLPHVMQVDYSNSALSNWLTAQNPSIDLFPRQFNGVPPIEYYPAHAYTSPWYPNHTSHQFDKVNDMYCLAGLGVESNTNSTDYLCVNMTNNISDNTCNAYQQNANPIMVNVATGMVIINVSQGTKQEGALSLGTPSWATLTSNDCVTQNAFKQSAVSNATYWYAEGKVFVSMPPEQDTGFGIYASDGKEIFVGKLSRGCASFELQPLCKGVYFIKILDKNGPVVLKVNH
jgi:hypothetical protein